MPHGEASEIIPAPSSAVFDLIHDYSRRLEWDTLLQAAYLDDGHTAAGQGVTSVCVGRRSLGGIALKTVYVTFNRPTLAAVKMVNAPPFFQSWAASIQHEDLSPAESRITYKLHFTSHTCCGSSWIRSCSGYSSGKPVSACKHSKPFFLESITIEYPISRALHIFGPSNNGLQPTPLRGGELMAKLWAFK